MGIQKPPSMPVCWPSDGGSFGFDEAILGMALGTLLAAPMVLLSWEEVLRSATLSAHGGNTLATAQLLDLLWPNFHGHPATETWTRTGWSGRTGACILGWGPRDWHCGRFDFIVVLRSIDAVVQSFCVLCCSGPPWTFNHARMASIGASLVAMPPDSQPRIRGDPQLLCWSLAPAHGRAGTIRAACPQRSTILHLHLGPKSCEITSVMVG